MGARAPAARPLMPTSCTCAAHDYLRPSVILSIIPVLAASYRSPASKTLRQNISLSTYRGVSCVGRLLVHSQSVRSKTTERKAGTNMASALRILHPPASASNTSPHPIIILNNGSRKAIFNAPEGTIRTNSTRKAGISGSKGDLDIYLQDATLATGGLPGLLMTLSDVSSDGRHNVHLYGPPSSAYSLATARFFAKRTSRQLWVHEANDLLGSESVWPLNRSSGQEAVRAIPTWPQTWSPSAAVSSLAPHFTDESSSSANSSSSGSHSSRKRRRQPSSQDDRDCENVEQGDNGEARRLNGSANTDEQTPMYGAPTSNAEYDAYISTRTQGDSNADADTENGAPDATAIAIATAQDMFKRSSTQSGPRGVQLDDPSAVPRGKGITPAWNASRLPRPAISAVSSARDQIATQPIAISYAITLPSLLGKVDATKAALLGVFPGPDIGSLQSGKAVTIRRPVGWSSWSEQDRQKWSSTRGGTKSKGKKARKDGDGDSSSIVNAPVLEEVSIQPSECVAAPQPGPVVFLVFLPSPSHIEAFLSDQNAARLDEATRDSAGKASLIIHTSPISVLTDKRYQDWLAQRSNAETQHVFTTTELGRDLILFPSSALGLLRMSILDDKMFRFPPYRLQRREDLLAACLPGNVSKGQVTIADRDTTVDLQPRFSRPQLTTNIWQAHGDDVTYDVEAPEGTEDYAAKTAKMAFEDDASEARDDQVRKAVLRKERHAAWLEYLEAAKRARADVQELTANGQARTDARWDGIKVTTLGTGSAAPSKYRSVAATLVQLPGRLFATGAHGRDQDPVYVLLDAGEGTLGQLTQRFGGGQELDTILARIRILFVSHIHGDHCAGVVRVLRARAELKPTQPLYLVSNVFTRQFLQEWNDLQDIGLPARTDRNDGQCDGSAHDRAHNTECASVVMLESEHLDYTFGVGSKAEDDEDYIAHLESGYRPGYERWRERLRQEVIAQPAFAKDTRSSEIDEEVQKLAEQRNPSLRGGKEPSFGHSARKQYDMKRGARDMTRDGLKRLHQDLGHGVDLTTVEVDHRARHCYGIVMRMRGSDNGDGAVEASNDVHHGGGFSFSYSGDTRPTARLEKAAANVDLYIHEATMQEEEASEAYARGHSTIRGAIQSGRRAGARVILLTHFSQRYPKMARIGESMALDGQDTQSSGGSSSSNGQAQPATVAIGMDLLEMEMNDMWKMERYLPAIEVLYNAEAAGDGGEAGEGGEVSEAVVDGQADVVMKDGGS